MIRRIAVALFLLAPLSADYSGKWQLDLDASKDIPERMKNGAKTITSTPNSTALIRQSN